MLKFNRLYFVSMILLLITEILIAKFAHDHIVRPYVGDLLVVILIYCFIKSFFNTPILKTALSVLIFSYAVETLQYFHFINRIGLQNSRFARIIIGTSFAWADLFAYTIGIAIIIYLEKVIVNRNNLKVSGMTI